MNKVVFSVSKAGRSESKKVMLISGFLKIVLNVR